MIWAKRVSANSNFCSRLSRSRTSSPASNEPRTSTIRANENTFIFQAPPGGLSGRADPIGVLGVNSDGSAAFYGMKRKSKSAKKYVLEEPVMLPNATAKVTDFRDVVQGKEVKRWLKVETQDGSGREGWVLWGNVGSRNATMEWVN